MQGIYKEILTVIGTAGCTTIYNKTTITECKYNARPICPSREGRGTAVRAGESALGTQL